METYFKERIAISIVAYNAPEYLIKCLDSIKWVKDEPNVKLFIFDNSPDDIVEKLLNGYRSNGFEFTYTRSDKNIGFGGGHNQNYAKANAFEPEFLLLLNPDMTISKLAIGHLIMGFNSVENLEIGGATGITAPKLLNGENVEYSLLHDTNFLKLGFMLFKELLGFKKKVYQVPLKRTVAEGVSGACMLISAKLINEIGLFDEQYFMYNEDNDFCLRVRKAGWKIYYVPEATAEHFVGRSSESMPDRDRWLRERMLLSNLLYFRKHKGRFQTFMLKQIWLGGLLLRIPLRRDPEWAREMYKEISQFNISNK